jgi:hypothetical protein
MLGCHAPQRLSNRFLSGRHLARYFGDFGAQHLRSPSGVDRLVCHYLGLVGALLVSHHSTSSLGRRTYARLMTCRYPVRTGQT